MNESEFECSICRDSHKYPFGMQSEEPPELTQKNQSVLKSGFFYIVNQEYVLTKAKLKILINEAEQIFEWELWVKISGKNFSDLSKNNSSFVDAKIVSDLDLYQNTIGVKVKLKFEYSGKISYPEVVRIYDDSNSLYEAFHGGIPLAYFQSWIETCLH